MRLNVIIVSLLLLLLACVAPARAQDGSDPTCDAIYQATLTAMMANCFAQPSEIACAASGEVSMALASGQTVTRSGSAARITSVTSIEAAPVDGAWSLASLYVPDMVDPQISVSMLILGPATLTFNTDSNLPYGQDFALTSAPAPDPCSGLAMPGVLIQSPPGSLTLLRVNGTDLAVNGTALIRALDDTSIIVSALTRETILSQSGIVVFAGFRARALQAQTSEVVPYDPVEVANLPTQLLPEIQPVALPGNAMVTQQVNLHLRPDPASFTNTRVVAGVPVNVFARSLAGDFLRVRIYDGAVGWVPASALDLNIPVDIPVYDTPPPEPTRPFGSVQAYVVTNEELNNLRAGPGQDFEIVETVPLRTELALLGRSPDDQWLLVETVGSGVRAWISVALISNTTPYALAELPYPPESGG